MVLKLTNKQQKKIVHTTYLNVRLNVESFARICRSVLCSETKRMHLN